MSIVLRHVSQPIGSRLCGQACVAMVAGLDLEGGIQAVGHKHSTTTWDLIEALVKLGIKCEPRLRRLSKGKMLPETAIIKVKYGKKRMFHWMVKDNGALFDPEPSNSGMVGGRVTSYLEVIG